MTEVERTSREDQRNLKLATLSLERSSEPSFWLGRDARFIYVNDAACTCMADSSTTTAPTATTQSSVFRADVCMMYSFVCLEATASSCLLVLQPVCRSRVAEAEIHARRPLRL